MFKKKNTKSFTLLNGSKGNLTGFTLIEMLVAVAIFALVVSVSIGIFLSGIKSQRKILATQQLLDETSYVMEYMSRAIRMAKRDDGSCITSGYNYQTFGGGIAFKDYQNRCQIFYFDGGKLKESKAGTINNLTSDNLEVKLFNIRIKGEQGPPADADQPKITIFLDIEHKKQPVNIQIQTTISQRNLDM